MGQKIIKLLGVLTISCFITAVSVVLSGCDETQSALQEYTWVAVDTVPPTCSEQGYTLYRCVEDPSKTYKADFTFIDHDAHDWVLGTDYVIPQYTRPTKLSDIYGNFVTIPADDIRTASNGVVAPNCIAEGFKIYVCNHNPQHIRLEEIKPIDPNVHNWVKHTDYEISTDRGKTIILETGERITVAANDIRSTANGWIDGGVVRSNCIAKGFTVYICSLDKQTIKYGNPTPIDASSNGHKWVVKKDYEIPQFAVDTEIPTELGSSRKIEIPAYDKRNANGLVKNGVVSPTCISEGFTVEYCEFCKLNDGSIVERLTDIMPPDPSVHSWIIYEGYTTPEYIEDTKPGDGLITPAGDMRVAVNGVVPPTSSARGYTAYICEYSRDIKHSDFTAVDPNIHHDDYGKVWVEEELPNDTRPQILRSYDKYSQNYTANYYEGPEQYLQKYSTTNFTFTNSKTATVSGSDSGGLIFVDNVKWFKITVSADTFVQMELGGVSGSADITIYEFDDSGADSIDSDTRDIIFSQNVEISNKIKLYMGASERHFVTLLKGSGSEKTYFMKVKRSGISVVQSISVTKILETETKLAETIYDFYKNAGNFSFGNDGTYSENETELTIRVNGQNFTIYHSTVNETTYEDEWLRHKQTRLETNNWRKGRLVKVYGFANDIWTFATSSLSITESQNTWKTEVGTIARDS
jgi:hypothetical protein